MVSRLEDFTHDYHLQEMTEQGIPLLILFYHPDQPEVKDLFKARVMEELRDQRGTVLSSNWWSLCAR